MTSTTARGLLAATAIALTSAACATGPAAAQVRGSASQDRLERLESEIRDLQSVVYSRERPTAPIRQGGVIPSGQSASSPQDVVRIAQMEQEIAQLTGRIEELTFRLAGQQRQLDTIMAVLGDTRGGGVSPQGDDADADADAAAVALSETLGDEGVDTGGPEDLGDPAPQPQAQSQAEAQSQAVTVDLPDNEDDAYDIAYEALLAGDYDRSEAAFEAYIAAFPEGVRTAEAKYLLGEIYLATGAYAEAATTFLSHVKLYPKDVRAPEAYLKLGTAFARLDKGDEACKVFRVGQSKFPQMTANVRARFEAESRKAACAG